MLNFIQATISRDPSAVTYGSFAILARTKAELARFRRRLFNVFFFFFLEGLFVPVKPFWEAVAMLIPGYSKEFRLGWQAVRRSTSGRKFASCSRFSRPSVRSTKFVCVCVCVCVHLW